MSRPVFKYSHDIEVLEKLVEVPLITNLDTTLKAVRLWVILRSLYSEAPLSYTEFDYNEWRDFFFVDGKQSHPRDSKPTHNDPECPCSKTIKELLFDGFDQDKQWQIWKQSFKARYQNFGDERINNFLQDLENQKPFYVVGKALKNYFIKLEGNSKVTTGFLLDKQWLKKGNSKECQLVEELPVLFPQPIEPVAPQPQNNDEEKYPFLLGDFASFANIFSTKINGIYRFFIHPDYYIPDEARKRTWDWLRKLRENWEKTPVLPVKIDYFSASRGKPYTLIIYPVCIYYYQRTFYLCAFGQNPQQEQLDWYNYRLDRIEYLDTLDYWDNAEINNLKSKCYHDQDTINEFCLTELIAEIQNNLSEAYGVDFYLPHTEMLLCFNPEFHLRYIKNSFRHNSFKEISHKKAINLLQDSALSTTQKNLLIEKLKLQKSLNYGYYTLNYRLDDNSVIMRLRAWCPNVEVLLPWDLRKKMKNDMQKTWEFYQHDID